jgi:D-alanyl-D-alanine dipeptidase
MTINYNEIAIATQPLPNWQLVSQIPIIESGERLQPASLAPAPISIYPMYSRMGIPSAPAECHLRQGVYRRLLKAANSLPNGLRLIVLDGWRPYSVQQHLFDTLINLMEHADPQCSTEKRLTQARNLVSPPSNLSSAPSPHLTGGAVDVTLANEQGEMLDMGSLFDEASPTSYTASLENVDDLNTDQLSARNNRRILYNVMIEAGFTNLPSEWWHFDFGDQLWAWYTKSANAIYGATHTDSLETLWQQQLTKTASL